MWSDCFYWWSNYLILKSHQCIVSNDKERLYHRICDTSVCASSVKLTLSWVSRLPALGGAWRTLQIPSCPSSSADELSPAHWTNNKSIPGLQISNDLVSLEVSLFAIFECSCCVDTSFCTINSPEQVVRMSHMNYLLHLRRSTECSIASDVTRTMVYPIFRYCIFTSMNQIKTADRVVTC